jgi:hypothetical protein
MAGKGAAGAVTRRGELAIRARQKVAKATAKSPGGLNTVVSKSKGETFVDTEADSAIKAPARLVKVCGEAVDLDDLGFITSTLVDTLESPNSISVDASEQRIFLASEAGVLQSAVDASETAQAGNSLEKMLTHQMAAGHRAAMRLVARVGSEQLPIVEMARLSNAAARMMQVFQEGLLALHKLRTGGKQTVVVQHVQVSEGGQAVIAGSMAAGEGA